jgi:Skp family chaperone for outer membrane proteins
LENAFRDNGFNAEATQVGVTNNIIDDMYRVTRDRVGDFPPFLERYNEIKKDFKWNIDFMQSAHPAHIPSKVDQNGSPLDGEGNAKYWELVSDMIGTFGLEGGHTSSDAKAILKGAGIGELGNPLGFWGFMALMAKIAATIAVALIIADTIKPLLAAYATAAEATRKLQERISQRQDQMDEEIDRENENLEEEESAIDADPSLTPAQKQTRKEDARDKHRGRVDVIKKKNDDANDKDRRDTEKDIETLGEHSPLGDLKALIIPAAALLVGGLVITKL